MPAAWDSSVRRSRDPRDAQAKVRERRGGGDRGRFQLLVPLRDTTNNNCEREESTIVPKHECDTAAATQGTAVAKPPQASAFSALPLPKARRNPGRPGAGAKVPVQEAAASSVDGVALLHAVRTVTSLATLRTRAADCASGGVHVSLWVCLCLCVCLCMWRSSPRTRWGSSGYCIDASASRCASAARPTSTAASAKASCASTASPVAAPVVVARYRSRCWGCCLRYGRHLGPLCLCPSAYMPIFEPSSRVSRTRCATVFPFTIVHRCRASTMSRAITMPTHRRPSHRHPRAGALAAVVREAARWHPARSSRPVPPAAAWPPSSARCSYWRRGRADSGGAAAAAAAPTATAAGRPTRPWRLWSS
jgi:hypothetical protein